MNAGVGARETRAANCDRGIALRTDAAGGPQEVSKVRIHFARGRLRQAIAG
jgi:hypothetical protein